jgi:hypothetical protein
MIKGIKVHPDNPLLFDFILDTGKSGLKINSPEFKAESQKLIKYFLASLTIKEDDLWVNLSPYEKDRMIPQELGATELGRDMLAQDYILKQLTASLIYPEKQLGKKFWDNVYTKARQMYGVTDIPVNTFNKVWIVADKAKVLEHNNAAYVVGSHLKVMLEEDYLALSKNTGPTQVRPLQNDVHSLASQTVRAIILPELEKEVNQGQNFAPLRQMFYSMILASWYKLALKDALLNQVYSNKGKTSGVLSDDPSVKEKIYQQYLKAYKKGVFNYIKEDIANSGLPRKYFSGGEKMRLRIGENLMIEHEQSRGDAPLKDGDLAMASVQIAGKNKAAVAESEELKNGGWTSLKGNFGRGSEEIDTRIFIKTANFMIDQLKEPITGPKHQAVEMQAKIFSYSSSSAYFSPDFRIARWIIEFLTKARYYEGDPLKVDEQDGHSSLVLKLGQNVEAAKGNVEKVKTALEKFRQDLRKVVRSPFENGDIPQALLEIIVRTDAAMMGKTDKAMTVQLVTSLPRIEDVIEITAQEYKFGLKATQAAEDIRLYLEGNASPRDTANRLIGLEIFDEYKEAMKAIIIAMVQSTIPSAEMPVGGKAVEVNHMELVGNSILNYFREKGYNYQHGTSTMDPLKWELIGYYMAAPFNFSYLRAQSAAGRVLDVVNQIKNNPDSKLQITIYADRAMKADLAGINRSDYPIVSTVLKNLKTILGRNIHTLDKLSFDLGTKQELLGEKLIQSGVYQKWEGELQGKRFDKLLDNIIAELAVSDKKLIPEYVVTHNMNSDMSRRYSVYSVEENDLLELNMKALRAALLKNIQPLLNKVSNTALLGTVKPYPAMVQQDSAMKTIAKDINGGIDLNARNMGLDVARDGKGIEMNFDPAMVAEFQKGNFTGVEGIILRIIPIQSPLPILGLGTALPEGHLAKG